MGVIKVLSINMTSQCLNSFQTYLTSHNFTRCFFLTKLLIQFILTSRMLRRIAAPVLFLPCLWFTFCHMTGVASKTGDAYPFGAPGLTSFYWRFV